MIRTTHLRLNINKIFNLKVKIGFNFCRILYIVTIVLIVLQILSKNSKTRLTSLTVTQAGNEKNHICPTYQILVYSNHCTQLTPSLHNASSIEQREK